MKKIKRMAVLAAVVLIFVLLPRSSASAQEIPIINFEKLENTMNNKNDTVYLFNFWATWCKPCVAELPYFEKITKEYQDKNVKVVLVNLDFRNQYEKKLVPFVTKNEIQSNVVMLDAPDYNSWIDKVSPEWSGAIPATVVLHGKSGTRRFYEKSFTYRELEQIVKPLINL